MAVPHIRMSPAQDYLYGKIRGISRRRADALIATLTDAQKAELANAVGIIRNSRIIVNLNLHELVFNRLMIDRLLKAERILNLYEIAHAGQEANPQRMRLRGILEFKLYGGTTDIQGILAGMSNVEHPNYGLIDYLAEPVGYSLVGNYGWYRFVLYEHVRDRSTFSPADALYITSDQTFVWDDIDGVLATRVGQGREYWFECINSGTIPIDSNGNVSYIETQILGGIWLENDIEMLYYPETDEFDDAFFNKLEELYTGFNIRLESY